MAQRANTPRGTTASPPTVEEVRLALSHFVELAAAFEGRGVALAGGPRDADINTLTDVTRALLRHRAVQRRSQADLVHGLAVNVLAEAYRGAQNGTQLDLQTRMVEEFGQLGIELSDADLDQLVVLWAVDKDEARLAAIARSNPTTTRAASDSGPEEVTIKGSGGPVEAAKKTLGSVLDRGTRTLHDVKEAVEETPPMRAAFGRWIGTAERHRYVDELRASWLKEPGSAHAATLLSGSLGSLKQLEEARGDVFDATVEKGALAFLTTAEGLLSIVTAESNSPALVEASATSISRQVVRTRDTAAGPHRDRPRTSRRAPRWHPGDQRPGSRRGAPVDRCIPNGGRGCRKGGTVALQCGSRPGRD
jgi:hypothetical protein